MHQENYFDAIATYNCFTNKSTKRTQTHIMGVWLTSSERHSTQDQEMKTNYRHLLSPLSPYVPQSSSQTSQQKQQSKNQYQLNQVKLN